jgi:hypothetical protein
MGRKFTAIAAMVVMLSTVLAFSAVAAPAEAKDSKVFKMVETRDVDLEFTFTLQDLASSDLVALVPTDILSSVDPETQVSVHLTASCTLMLWSRRRTMPWTSTLTSPGTVRSL